MNLCYRDIHYDSELGKFTSKDPYRGRLKSPLSHINSYNYVSNNPRNFIDPSGAFSVSLTLSNIFEGGASAIFAGFVGAYYNYSDARDSGASGFQTVFSTVLGATIGSLTSAYSATVVATASATIPVVGPYVGAALTIPVAAAGAFFNNSINQLVYHGSIDLDRSFNSAKTAAIVQGISLAFGGWLGPVYAIGSSAVAATCVDNGILSNDELESKKENTEGFSCETVFSY